MDCCFRLGLIPENTGCRQKMALFISLHYPDCNDIIDMGHRKEEFAASSVKIRALA